MLDVADVLLWGTEAPEDRVALEAEPLYTALEEVRDGRLVFTDGITAGAIYFTSPLSLPFVLEHLVPALASTIAGDGPAVVDATAPGQPPSIRRVRCHRTIAVGIVNHRIGSVRSYGWDSRRTWE